MGAMGIGHWILVGAVVLIFFGGRGKISEMMGDMAKGIKAFKKGMQDDDTAAAHPPATSAAASTDTVRTLEHRSVEPVGTSSSTLADRKVG